MPRERAIDVGALLSSWRARPAAETANALDHALAAVASNDAPRDQASFLERAKEVDAGDLPELAALLSSLRTRKLDEVAGRVSSLARLLPDPRVARGLYDLVRAVPFTSDSSMATWTKILGVVAEAGDPRLADWLAEVRAALDVRASFKPWLEAQLLEAESKVRARFPEGAPSADETTRELIAAVPVPKAKVAPAEEASLFAAVYANPDDDGPRLVLADFLQERDDLRGALIMLQCRSPGSKRERELIKAHAKKWLGELEPFVTGQVEFRRGFPAKVTLKQLKASKQAKRALDLPGWSTIETLSIGTGGYLPSTLRAVRAVYGLREQTIEALRTACPHARPRTLSVDEVPRFEDWATFEAGAACAELDELSGVPIGHLGGSLAKLRRLTVSETLEDAHLDAVATHPQLTILVSSEDLDVRVAMVEQRLAVTFVLGRLGERRPEWAEYEAKHVNHWLETSGARLIETLTRPLGLRSIQSLTIERRPPDPKLVAPPIAKRLETTLRTVMMAHLDHLEALASFDLTSIGGKKGERAPRRTSIERAPAKMPALEAYASLAWCSDGTIFVMQADKTVLLDAPTGAVRRVIRCASGRYMNVTPDGRTLVEAEPRVAYVFDVAAGTEARRVEHEVGYVSGAKLSADGRRLAMLIGDVYQTRKLAVVSLDGARGDTLLSKGGAKNVAITKDTCILARAADIQLLAIGRPTETPVVLAKVGVDSDTSLALSPSGCTLAAQTNHAEAIIFDLTTRSERARFSLKRSLHHTCDDRHVAVATETGVMLCDIEEQTTRTLAVGKVTQLAIAPDGEHIAARIQGALVVVDLAGKELLRVPCNSRRA